MSFAIKGSAKNLLDKAINKATDAGEKLREEYANSGLKEKVEGHSAQLNKVLEESGVKAKAEKIASVTSETLDTVSGVKILNLVEERLALQAKYNDILATKLDEALEKIKQLEEQLEKGKSNQ